METSKEEQTEIIRGYLDRKRVYLPLTETTKEFREKGFGELKRKRIYLSPLESLYLLDKKRIMISTQNKGEITLYDLVTKLTIKNETWIKYLIYRDLRDRGYIVRESHKFDFEVYGKGSLRRLVSIVHEGGDTSLSRLTHLLSYAKNEKKELILSVIDRRTDIVYYTLETLEMPTFK